MTYWNDIETVATLDLPWHLLSGKNILITGATGLIGGCLVDILMHHPISTTMSTHLAETRKGQGRDSRNMKPIPITNS